ncbi:MAG: hypothetical protein GX122_05545 [Candidatus Cloacimonetes bacterium]|nr:hypothetical protein [Candidatus Cloacimonadota bacterium]
MFFYPLLLGFVAISFPFLSLMGMMAIGGRSFLKTAGSLSGMLLPFFVLPLIFLLWQPQTMMISALDAIIGVGGVCLAFLWFLKSNRSLNNAFTVSALIIIIYGLLRIFLWGPQLTELHAQAFESISGQLPAHLDAQMISSTLSIVKDFWPVYWIISQIMALFVGFIIFQRMLGIKFQWATLRFPAIYNVLFLAVLPLYFVPSVSIYFYNGLLALCAIPFLQGLAMLIQRMALIFTNNVIRAVILIILLLNFLSYPFIILFGFAGIWWNQRNIKPGGNPA